VNSDLNFNRNISQVQIICQIQSLQQSDKDEAVIINMIIKLMIFLGFAAPQ
jgi:hypothetical protein